MSQSATGAAEETGPFVKTSPGDLITADLVNGIQVQTREEIARKIREAVGKITRVDSAGNADRLEGKTRDELAREIVDQALKAIPKLTSHRVVYKRLQPGEPALIRHEMHTYPLVDVYQLQDFEVVASADEVQTVEFVYWYLYHRTEMKIRRPKDDPTAKAAGASSHVTIEASRGPVFKHSFQSMLDLYGVDYDEESTLGDVVNEFWKKLFSDPNDQFDETSFANSPWFDRCCGDRRTVASLKRGGEWNDLYLKVRPLKTINVAGAGALPDGVLVEHYNLEELGLWWLAGEEPETLETARAQEDTASGTRDLSAAALRIDPRIARLSTLQLRPIVAERIGERIRLPGTAVPSGTPAPPPRPDEIRVMVLLKV